MRPVSVPVADGWDVHLDDSDPGQVWIWLYDRSDNVPIFCWVVDDGVWENMSFGEPCQVRNVPAVAREEYVAFLRCYAWNHCWCCSHRFPAGDGQLGDICAGCGWEVDELEATDAGYDSTANHAILERYHASHAQRVGQSPT